jgi:hypothetical protein
MSALLRMRRSAVATTNCSDGPRLCGKGVGISAIVSATPVRDHGAPICDEPSRFDIVALSLRAKRELDQIRPLQLSLARPRRTGGQGGQRNPSGYMPLDDSGMVQDESGGAAEGPLTSVTPTSVIWHSVRETGFAMLQSTMRCLPLISFFAVSYFTPIPKAHFR